VLITARCMTVWDVRLVMWPLPACKTCRSCCSPLTHHHPRFAMPRRWGSPRGYRLQHISGIPQVLPPPPTFNATRGIDWSYYKVRGSGEGQLAGCRAEGGGGAMEWATAAVHSPTNGYHASPSGG
jgi:hypothetical protein